jgi:aryl-alcohol dehydrogenase-like predicted oxidoreductase
VSASRPLGTTGLSVSPLGFGAGGIGDAQTPDADVAHLLGAALDLGFSLVDTARSYGLSEERIGRHLAGRRREFVLSTKVGYGMPGIPDWTGAAVAAGIDAALARLRTDVIDIVHLHSCPLDVLRNGGVVEPLLRAVQAGKVRVAAYSGDNAPLEWAASEGPFGSLQASVNLFDQRALENAVPAAAARGIGVIAKRALGNAPWRFASRPAGDEAEPYWDRMAGMRLPDFGLAPDELAIRFSAFAPGVATALVASRSSGHLGALAGAVAKGPLPEDVVKEIRAAFRLHGASWEGRI